MKRILSVFLVVLMAFGCLSVLGSAEFSDTKFKTSYDATKYTSAWVCTKCVGIYSDYVAYTYTYSYDSKGRMTKEIRKDSEGNTRTTAYTYDSNGNLIKETGKGYTTTYTYSGTGKLTKEVTAYSDGSKDSTTYRYNSSGKLIDDNDVSYVYNSKGYLTKKVYVYDDGDKAVTTYSYDSKGNLIKEASDDYSTAYTYDSNSNLIKKKNDTSTIAYTYDSYGNCIKEVETLTSGYKYITNYTWKKVTVTSPVIEGRIHIQYATATYTGSAKTPNVTIDGLKKGIDYNVTYSNNVNVGTAKAKITFFGEYADQHPVTVSFNIKAASLTSKDKTYLRNLLFASYNTSYNRSSSYAKTKAYNAMFSESISSVIVNFDYYGWSYKVYSSGRDPKNYMKQKDANCYYKFAAHNVDWILKNVYGVTPDHSKIVKSSGFVTGYYYNNYYYFIERYSDNQAGFNSLSFTPSNGYYIIKGGNYDSGDVNGRKFGTFSAKVKPQTVNGKKVWSIYSYTYKAV